MTIRMTRTMNKAPLIGGFQKGRHLWWPAFFVWFLAGCVPAGTEFDFGWPPTTMVGTLPSGLNNTQAPTLVLVQETSRLLTGAEGDFSASPLRRHSYTVPVASNGTFRFTPHASARQLQVWVIHRGYAVFTFSYEQQMGVGELRFPAEITPLPGDWGTYLMGTLQPFLSQYLLEPLLGLPPDQSQLVGQWLAQELDLLRQAP